MNEEVLVKYKYIEDMFDTDYIKAIYTSDPFELLRVAQQVDFINIDDEDYKYSSSEYSVPVEDYNLHVLNIYVDPVD